MAATALYALPQEGTSPNSLNPGTAYLTVESILGAGTFGLVVKCRRAIDSKLVAVKMLKRTSSNKRAIEEEISMLEEVQWLDPDKCNLVRWYRAFETPGHACLEFESLDKSLLDFMKEKWYRPLKLEVISCVTQQVSTALLHLKSLGIIHADLKPANIMLVDQGLQPYKVKVIDFGLAHKMSTARQGVCIQTLPFRAPEVMLAMPYTTAVDVWSLGCIAAFLYQGTLLYPGHTQYEMLRYIVQTQGQPPDTLLDMGQATDHYFIKDSRSNSWRLKNLVEYFGGHAYLFQDKRKTILNSLDGFLHLRPNHCNSQTASDAHRADVAMFVDLLKGMLHLDAARRLTPREVQQHPFITRCHLKQNPSSPATSTQERAKVYSQAVRDPGKRAAQATGHSRQAGTGSTGARLTSVQPRKRKRTFDTEMSEAKRKTPWFSNQQSMPPQKLDSTRKRKMTEVSESHESPKKRNR